ncbi:MAG: PAS domain S-box protein, partial [Proteobacteria bacterium]|nr:PAS domain S-box protein [Pseudomonadota bacterium]
MSAAKPLNLSVRSKALLFAVLTGLGLAGNYFSVPVLYDTDFVFGSIFSLLALQLLGARLGVASAFVARVDFVKADAIYWCVLGMPLAFLFYHYALRLPLPDTTNFMLMQALNGIGNALIARLVFFGVAARLQLERASLRELIFNVLLLLALLLSLVTTSVNSRRERDMLDEGIRQSLDLGGARTVANLEGWLQGHMRRIGHLAEMAATQPLPFVQKTLELNIAGVEMKRVALLDRNASVIAHSETADKLGQPHIGRSFADRPYIPQLKQTLAPMLSEVVMSGLGFSEPIVGVLAPVVAKGAYAGYVIGVLDLAPVEKLIALNTRAAIWESLNYALVDKNGKVILSNNAKLKIMQPFAREPGELIALPGGLAQWWPAPKQRATAAERWTESAYVFEATVDKTSGWRLVLEVPSHQFAENMYTGYARRRLFVAVIVLFTFLLAGALSRKISASLEDLKRVSADLPRRLSGGEEIDWGHSAIADVQDLKDNFSVMAQELTQQFGENRAFNASLESKVARRTAELNTHKAELEAQNEDLRRTQVDLEAAQARYFELYQLAPVGYVSISKPGLILQANLNACTRLGVARGALLGQPISRFILREDQDVFYKNRKQLFETGEAQAFELRMVKHDGTLFWAHLAASAVQDADGAPELRVVLTDITERKAAEDEVRRSEARHISMVSNISDVIAIIGADGTVKYRSPNVEKWFGWQPQDLAGANGWLTVHPDDLKRIQEKFFALLEKDNSVAVMEYRFKCKDGSYRPIELHATNRVNDPAIGGVLLNYHDITARRQAEAEVRKLSHAVMQSPTSVVITDRAGNIEYVNAQFEKQTGYAMAEVLGRNPRILKSGRTPEETYREMWRAISAGGEWRGELCNRRKDGALLWESAAISGIKDENGQVTHFVAVKEDIGERKQAAEALREIRAREIGIGASLQRSLLSEV